MCRFSAIVAQPLRVLRRYDAQTYHKQPHNRQADINQSDDVYMHKQVSGFEITCTCADSGTQAQFFPLPLIKKTGAWVQG